MIQPVRFRSISVQPTLLYGRADVSRTNQIRVGRQGTDSEFSIASRVRLSCCCRTGPARTAARQSVSQPAGPAGRPPLRPGPGGARAQVDRAGRRRPRRGRRSAGDAGGRWRGGASVRATPKLRQSPARCGKAPASRSSAEPAAPPERRLGPLWGGGGMSAAARRRLCGAVRRMRRAWCGERGGGQAAAARGPRPGRAAAEDGRGAACVDRRGAGVMTWYLESHVISSVVGGVISWELLRVPVPLH